MKKLLSSLFLLFTIQATALEFEQQFENERVNVVRVLVNPGDEIDWHRDAFRQVVVTLQGGIVTRLEDNGDVNDVIFETGKTTFREPDPEGCCHRTVNRFSDPVEIILIQLKD